MAKGTRGSSKAQGGVAVKEGKNVYNATSNHTSHTSSHTTHKSGSRSHKNRDKQKINDFEAPGSKGTISCEELPADSGHNLSTVGSNKKDSSTVVVAAAAAAAHHQHVVKQQLQPTSEQLMIARITDFSSPHDDPHQRQKIQKVIDITGKAEDAVATALFDAEWDESRAIDLLLENGDHLSAWEETGKRGKKKQKQPVDDAPREEEESGDGLGSNQDSREKSRQRGPPRMRRGGDRGGRNRCVVGDRGVSGSGSSNDMQLANGGSEQSSSRGQGSEHHPRRGGRGSRSFQGRGRRTGGGGSGEISGGFSGSIDTWNPGQSNETGTDEGANSSLTVTGAAVTNIRGYSRSRGGGVGQSNKDAFDNAGKWGDDFPQTDDWDNEEYTGSLADTKVFTASSNPARTNQQLSVAAVKGNKPVSQQVPTSLVVVSPQQQSLISGGQQPSTKTPPQQATQLLQGHSVGRGAAAAAAAAYSTNNGPSNVNEAQSDIKQSTTVAAASYSQSIDLSTLLQKPTTQSSIGASSSQQHTLLQFNQQATESIKAAVGIGQGASGGKNVSDMSVSYTPYSQAQSGNAAPYNQGSAATYTGIKSQQQIVGKAPPAPSSSTSSHHHKSRMPPPSKIPNSAVEMPGESLGRLDVQFGGLDLQFGGSGGGGGVSGVNGDSGFDFGGNTTKVSNSQGSDDKYLSGNGKSKSSQGGVTTKAVSTAYHHTHPSPSNDMSKSLSGAISGAKMSGSSPSDSSSYVAASGSSAAAAAAPSGYSSSRGGATSSNMMDMSGGGGSSSSNNSNNNNNSNSNKPAGGNASSNDALSSYHHSAAANSYTTNSYGGHVSKSTVATSFSSNVVGGSGTYGSTHPNQYGGTASYGVSSSALPNAYAAPPQSSFSSGVAVTSTGSYKQSTSSAISHPNYPNDALSAAATHKGFSGADVSLGGMVSAATGHHQSLNNAAAVLGLTSTTNALSGKGTTASKVNMPTNMPPGGLPSMLPPQYMAATGLPAAAFYGLQQPAAAAATAMYSAYGGAAAAGLEDLAALQRSAAQASHLHTLQTTGYYDPNSQFGVASLAAAAAATGGGNAGRGDASLNSLSSTSVASTVSVNNAGGIGTATGGLAGVSSVSSSAAGQTSVGSGHENKSAFANDSSSSNTAVSSANNTAAVGTLQHHHQQQNMQQSAAAVTNPAAFANLAATNAFAAQQQAATLPPGYAAAFFYGAHTHPSLQAAYGNTAGVYQAPALAPAVPTAAGGTTTTQFQPKSAYASYGSGYDTLGQQGTKDFGNSYSTGGHGAQGKSSGGNTGAGGGAATAQQYWGHSNLASTQLW